MTENPYESPQEPNQPAQPAYKFVPVAGCLLAASLPSAFICGGITCYSAGIAGEALNTEAGWMLGIPVALVVVGLIPYITYLAVRRMPN